MRKAFILGAALLLCCAISARPKPAPLTFVFLSVDRAEGVAYLRPMIAPDLGVQLMSGPQKLERGAVLRCGQSTQTQPAIVDGQVSTVSELVLVCGRQKFVVTGLDFSQRSK
jgi:hypothetical protein